MAGLERRAKWRVASGEWRIGGTSPYSPPPIRYSQPSLPLRLRQHRDAGEEQVTGHPDQHEIDEEHEGPTEIVADHLALVAHVLAGRHADTGGLRRDRLADLGTDRVQSRQQHQREAEQLPDQRLEFYEHGIGRGV